MRAWFKVAAELAQHQVIVDIEGTTTEKAAGVRMPPATASLLACHVAGEQGFVEVIGAYKVKDSSVLGGGEWLECVH